MNTLVEQHMGLGMTVEREILDLEGYVSQLKEEEGDDLRDIRVAPRVSGPEKNRH